MLWPFAVYSIFQSMASRGKGPMTKRDVIRCVLEGKTPPYVPWSMGFTKEAREKLQRHYGCDDLEGPAGKPPAEARQRHRLLHRRWATTACSDVFGVVWDRSVDKDIGNVEGLRAAGADAGRATQFPDPLDRRFFADIPEQDRAVSATASASSRSASRSTSGPGPCAAWRTC